MKKEYAFQQGRMLKLWYVFHLKCLPIYNQKDRNKGCRFVPLLQSLMQSGTLQEITPKTHIISTIHFQILSRTSIKLHSQT